MDATVTLPDGRTLGWATYGDPTGRPIMALHGSPDSRRIWQLAQDAAASAGVCVVAPDRPGFGLSSPHPGRSVLDWVDDHVALSSHLSLGPHPVVTVSGGSPYATAMAWARPDLVTTLGLVSVISPLGASGVLAGTNPQVRLTFRTAVHAPWLLRPLAAAMVRLAHRNPAGVERRLIATRPPADRSIIERPDVIRVLRANLSEQFRHAPSIAHEMRLAAQDWGFPLEEIDVRTLIWQGGLDDVHTPAMSRWLHSAIAGSELRYEPDFATFNFFDQLDSILAALLEPVP